MTTYVSDVLANWFYVRSITHKPTFVCVPAKCAGTSFYRAAFSKLFNAFHVRMDDIPDKDVRSSVASLCDGPYTPSQISDMSFSDKPRFILAYRNLHARFNSLWADKCLRGDPNMPELAGLSVAELICKIRECPFGNPHWIPQYAYSVPDMQVVSYSRLLSELGFENIRCNGSDSQSSEVLEATRPYISTIGCLYASDLDLSRRCSMVIR